MDTATAPAAAPADATIAAMQAALERSRAALLRDGPPPAALRRDRITRAIALLVARREAIAEALSADFGHRSRHQSLLTDVAAAVLALKHARRHLERWMKPERRRPDFGLGLLGVGAEVDYQPLGVVGVISPWNFPVNLTFGPLAGIFAAGNSVMIKPSEHTPRTAALMAEMFASRFDETEVAVFTGGPETAAAFSRLPFDHLLFTGATNIARHVMRAAAEHLVPVTLELGGKSPVLIGEGADLALAARRVMTGKTINAGQICLAPDYALVPEGKVEDFAAAAAAAVRAMYPSLKDNPDYTSVINQRHFERLQGYLDDARAKGARVIEINPAGEDFRQQPAHKMPPVLILDPSEDMTVMQEEIFGPLLPVKAYRRFEEAIAFVNARPRPLGLYYFGNSRAEQEMVRRRTTSGGVTINDVMAHAAIEDLPFGGVGPSGMGAYHGRDGFRRFSHAKAVSRQPTRLDLSALARPPYGRRIETAMRFVLRQ